MWSHYKKTWEWRKLVILHVGGNVETEVGYTPYVGGFTRAGDYLYGQTRGWFMKETLAFADTVDQELMDKMNRKLRDKPFNKKEHFAVLTVGYSQESSGEAWSDLTSGEKWYPGGKPGQKRQYWRYRKWY